MATNPIAERAEPRPSDAALIVRHLEGDARAFAELVRRHTPALRRYVTRFLVRTNEPDVADAVEDVLQDTWFRVHRHLISFDGKTAAFSTWVHTIARNLSINVIRDRKRSPLQRWPLLPVDASIEVEVEFADPHRSSQPDVALALEEDRAAIERLLRRIPTKHQEVLELRAEGRSYDDIAAQLGVGVGTVKSRFNRARSAMRRLRDND